VSVTRSSRAAWARRTRRAVERTGTSPGAPGEKSSPRNSESTSPWTALALIACLGFVGWARPAAGVVGHPRPLAEVARDETGRALHYPSALFVDGGSDELYLVNGGTSRVVVYGQDLFPLASIGAGHGVDAPRGGFVGEDGLIYICQSRTPSKPARLTVLNAAFFPVREFSFDQIPEAPDFSPEKVAVSRSGTLYVTGQLGGGVLVLDRDGTFLRRLVPMDQVLSTVGAGEALEGETPSSPEPPDQEAGSKSAGLGDIPEEFRPKGQREKEGQPTTVLGPVRIRSVAIDKAGNLYLLSAQTSKVYVYSPEEAFLFAFGEKGGTPGKLSQPRSLAIDENRKLIYVSDYMRHSILAFDMSGKLQFEFGGRGAELGWFNYPTDVVLNRRGDVFVADLFNHRLQAIEMDFSIQEIIRPDRSRGFQGREPARGKDEKQEPEK
jgi:hypothetical protein